jgi:hypothetical protein
MSIGIYTVLNSVAQYCILGVFEKAVIRCQFVFQLQSCFLLQKTLNFLQMKIDYSISFPHVFIYDCNRFSIYFT